VHKETREVRSNPYACSDNACALQPVGWARVGTNGGCRCLLGDIGARVRVRQGVRWLAALAGSAEGQRWGGFDVLLEGLHPDTRMVVLAPAVGVPRSSLEPARQAVTQAAGEAGLTLAVVTIPSGATPHVSTLRSQHLGALLETAVGLLEGMEWGGVGRCLRCGGAQPKHKQYCPLESMLARAKALEVDSDSVPF
jgi:hypothetical protein